MGMDITIVCMGDVMPGGILHYEQCEKFCSDEILSVLKQADIRVATLETAVGDTPNFDEEKMKRDKDVIYCPTGDLKRLVNLGINVVSLANNHAWDLGFKGIEHAKRTLDSLNIKYCGAGRNIEEASAPAVVEINGRKIAFIAYCDNKAGTCGYIPVATEHSPGINLMKESHIHNDIVKLKKEYDKLFVMMHWGKEYYYYPTPEVNTLAHKMIDWGADGVIGSHSHQIQPTIVYKGKPIIFSLGNFFFPDRFICKPRSTFYPAMPPSINDYPITDGYPFVDVPTFKRWKPVARIGQIITLAFNGNQVKTSRVFTKSDKNSHLSICEMGVTPLLFSLSHWLVRMPMYSTLFTVMRGTRFIKKKLTRQI